MGSAAYSNLFQPEADGCTDRDNGVLRGFAAGGHRNESRRSCPAGLCAQFKPCGDGAPRSSTRISSRIRPGTSFFELYALHLEQQRASVSSLYAASSVPGSTALRWIAKLEHEGLVVRTDDSLDARRSWIKLTDDGVARMKRLQRWSRSQRSRSRKPARPASTAAAGRGGPKQASNRAGRKNRRMVRFETNRRECLWGAQPSGGHVAPYRCCRDGGPAASCRVFRKPRLCPHPTRRKGQRGGMGASFSRIQSSGANVKDERGQSQLQRVFEYE